MPAKRPTSFTVFAILCLVFACFGFLCDTMNLAAQAFAQTIADMQPKNQPGQIDQQEMQRMLAANAPGYVAYVWGNIVLAFLMHLLLLLTGIGLLKMYSWSRPACMAYALLTILIQLVVVVYTIAFITPVMDDVLNKQFEAQKTPITVPGWVLNLGVIVGALLGMVFALILLIFAARPAMGHQLAAANRADGEFDSQEPQDYYDADYERQRHEPPPEL